MRKNLYAAALLLGSTMLASNAMAISVTVNPNAVGAGAWAPTTLDRFGHTYGATVNQTWGGANPFTETGAFTISRFFLNSIPDVAAVSGLGALEIPVGPETRSGFKMFGTFTSGGTSTFNPVTNYISSSFSSFVMNLYVDLSSDTGVTLENGTLTNFNVADDILVATGSMISGPNSALTSVVGETSSFKVRIDFVPQTGFFSGYAPYELQMSLNGAIEITSQTGSPPTTLTVTGDGKGVFDVPAPASLALFGAALAGLGLVRRRANA